MNKFALLILLLLSTVFFNPCMAQQRTIAITIDDLPFVGEEKNFHLNLIIDCIQKNQIPVTGFIIAETVKANNWPALERFRNTGNGLGNHTLTHLSLNQVDAVSYIDNIAEADRILKPVLTQPKYFRYPYLAIGKGEKKEQVLDYLVASNYHVAPVTIDTKDFVFNQQLLAVPEIERREFIEELIPVYLDYILLQTLDAEQFNRSIHHVDRAQILLIHANLLNAYVLGDIIKLYKKLGYRFVSLEQALSTFPSPNFRNKRNQKKSDEKHNEAKESTGTNPDSPIEEFKVWD